jgi:hypothetical protein
MSYLCIFNYKIDMTKIRKIGVLTSGGDSPGMNAAIRAVVKAGLHYKIEIMGIQKGYYGMIHDLMVPLDKKRFPKLSILEARYLKVHEVRNSAPQKADKKHLKI